MSEDKYSDNHFIYAVTDYATSDQIEHAIHSLLGSIGWSELKPKININVVTAARDEITKYSYIWVSSPKLFQLLTKTEDVTYEESYPHVIKYKHDGQDENLIKKIIENGITDCKKYLYDTYNYEEECNYTIHPITDCFDNSVYVTLDSEAVYHLLIGNNPDGTAREETVIEGDDDTDDWGAGEMVTKKLPALVELQDMEIHEYGGQIPKKYLCKSTGLKFDECLTLPPITYDKTQIERIRLLEPDRKEFIHHLKMSPGMIPYPDETEYNKNELIALNAPTWITVRIIKEKFRDYVTDKDAVYNTGKYNCTYPIIYIKTTRKGTNIIIVKFNEKSDDGLVANKMSRKLKLTSEDGKYSETLRFDYSKILHH